MEVPKTGDVLFLEHQISVLDQIWHQIRIPRPSFTLKPVKTGFLLHGSAETGDVLFLEHQISVLDQICHQIRIACPSFTLKPVKTGFYDACCTQNRKCSIFRTSGVGGNLNSYSDSPSLIYSKTDKKQRL